MHLYWIAPLAALLLAALLRAERSQRPALVLPVKTALSALFVILAVLQPHPLPGYYQPVLYGLVLGLAGDVCLALPSPAAFRAGLVAFLLGHLAYVWAFAHLVRPAHWINPALALLVAAAVGIFWWLRPRLGKLKGPVVAYIVVITSMLAGAWAVWLRSGLRPGLALAILLGALAFYLSDICVALDRFVRKEYLNRLLGLPLYYLGQFLLAWSVGLGR
jgi:uncharacterized membrane protein YhhN